MDKKIERVEYPDMLYDDETHSLCVYKDFLIDESIIDWSWWRTRTSYQFKIEDNVIWAKCLEAKCYWDEYGDWPDTDWFEKDSNWDFVVYRIRNGIPNPEWFSWERYKELEDYEAEHGKDFDASKDYDMNEDLYKLIMDEKKERDELIEEFNEECDWHKLSLPLVAKAFVFKQVLDTKKADEYIKKRISDIRKFTEELISFCEKFNIHIVFDDYWSIELEREDERDKEKEKKFYDKKHFLLNKYRLTRKEGENSKELINELEEIIETWNVKRSDNYWIENTMRWIESLKKAAGIK